MFSEINIIPIVSEVSSLFIDLFGFLILNTLVLLCLIKVIYAKRDNGNSYQFSFLAVGIIVFLLSYLLENVKLELGFALGLFAIFGILRYRTDAIPIREMTYLFMVIAISVINALAGSSLSFIELTLINGVILTGFWYLEHTQAKKSELSMNIIYERIQNIHASQNDELIEDLVDRTGLDVYRFQVNHIDFLKDVADITIYYNPTTQPKKSSNHIKSKIYELLEV